MKLEYSLYRASRSRNWISKFVRTNMNMRRSIMRLLVSVLAVLQAGCMQRFPSGPTLASSSQITSNLAGEDVDHINVPKNIDDFFENINYLVTSGILNGRSFCDSNKLIKKAFGASGVSRISYSSAKDHEPDFYVTIKLGEFPGQQCELHKNVGEFIQLYCGISGLAYVFNPEGQTDSRGALSRMQLNGMSEKIYKKFRDVFGPGWQEIDYFDRRRGEKIIVLGVTSQPGPAPQPKPSGFGKEIIVNDVIYIIRAGSAVNGNWNGVTIIAKKYPENNRDNEISN